jgi:hypothetical protein
MLGHDMLGQTMLGGEGDVPLTMVGAASLALGVLGELHDPPHKMCGRVTARPNLHGEFRSVPGLSGRIKEKVS